MKKMTRRSAVALGGAAALLPVTGFAQQESLPDKPLKILVGFPAGGGSDVMARLMAEALKQRTDRNVLIDNKAGASGMIAVDALKNAVPDGTTIAYVPSASIAPTLTMTAPSFDPLTDIQPITLAGTVQTAYCVSPTIGVNTLPEYIAWLKKNPTRASFGTTAMGSFTAADDEPIDNAQFFIAISPEKFAGRGFHKTIDGLVDNILSQEGTRLPNARREANQKRLKKSGLPIDSGLLETLKSYT